MNKYKVFYIDGGTFEHIGTIEIVDGVFCFYNEKHVIDAFVPISQVRAVKRI